MPEGPEVKTVARTLADKLIGKRLGTFWHSEFNLRHPVDYAKIREYQDRLVDNVSCYGKLLFVDIEGKPALLAQLGMTGQLTVAAKRAPMLAHTHIRWPLLGTDQELRYVDPRRFGLFEACDASEKKVRIGKLGPDPFNLSADDVSKLGRSITKSTRCIKEIILDQSVVVGVGNIYASEALFRAAINPTARGCDIQPERLAALIKAIVDVLHDAYTNGGTSFSDYVDGTGKKGDNLSYLSVFQRTDEPCKSCGTAIKRIKQGGRSSFFCPTCQKTVLKVHPRC